MSVLRRPHGDATAQKFGSYKTENEVRKLVAGDKFDVLCDGGIHYVAKVVYIDQSLNGQLHFCKWNEKYDHVGSFKELYLADAGQYSAGTLNGANQYIDPNDVISSRRKTNQGVAEEGGMALSYAEKTRYEDDYLFKPYRSDRKRRAMDAVIQIKENEIVRDDEVSLQPVKKVASDFQVALVTPTIGEGRNGIPAGDDAPRKEGGLVPVDSVSDIPLHAPSDTDSTVLVEVADQVPSTIIATREDHRGGPHIEGDGGGSGGKVERGGADPLTSAGQLADAGHSADTVPKTGGPGVTLRALQPLRSQVEYVAAPNPFLVSGGRILPRWRHFYQQMLRDSGDAECRDVATAMEWLHTHLETMRSRGTVKGKVYGPLAMLCVTHDVHSAVMLEHAMGRKLLLGFLVDRLQDQQYLEDRLVNQQGLNVKVWFSGTRDRFDGYKALASTYANPVPGCELTNLGDRLLCGQLIRNLMHSEGCTGQLVLGGTLAASAGTDGTAALKNVFSRAGAAHAGKVVVYLAEAGGSEHQVRRYTYEPGAGYPGAEEAGPQVHAESIPLLRSQATAGESLRLLYSYAEQLERAESVPAHLVVAPAAPAPSMSSKHAVSNSYTAHARAAATSRTGYEGAASSSGTTMQAGLAPHRAHLTAQSFAGLSEFDAARATAEALALRTASGGVAVWHLLGKQPGLWFPSWAALARDLQQQAAAGSAAAGSGAADTARDGQVPAIDSQGLFVSLTVFTQHHGPENGELGAEPTLFGHTWPLELASFPAPAFVPAPIPSNTSLAPAGAVLDNADQEREAGREGTAVAEDAVPTEAAIARKEIGEECAMEVEGEGRGQGSPLPLDLVPGLVLDPLPLPLPLPIEPDNNADSSSESGPVVGAADGREGGGGESAAAAGEGQGEQGGMVEQGGSCTAVQGGGPHLALNKKTGAIGLAFLTSGAFRAWHRAVLAENGEDFELAEVAADKAAFLALASIRGSAEYYDLRLVKRKHAVLFSTQEPRQAAAVGSLLRRNSEAVARNEYSLRNGGSQSNSSSSSSAHRAGGLSPLPLSVLMRGGGSTVADLLATQPHLHHTSHSWQAPGGGALPRPDLRFFRTHLANDATIVKLESSLNHLDAVSSELSRSGVDVACLRKLLSAQLQLARATRLVLK